MTTITIISMAFLIGGMMGFFFAACLAMGEVTPALQSTTPAPPYQGGEFGELGAEEEDRMAAYPMSRKGIEAWEKEQTKREKKRRR